MKKKVEKQAIKSTKSKNKETHKETPLRNKFSQQDVKTSYILQKVTWLNENDKVTENTGILKDKLLQNSENAGDSFNQSLKAYVAAVHCKSSQNGNKDCIDFMFKKLRKSINEFDESRDDNINVLLDSCKLMFESLTVLLSDPLSFCIPEETVEKGIKILFHVCKQLYKRNLIKELLSLITCMKEFSKYCRKHKICLKDEIQKLFFMIHQMEYSLFTKEIQKIMNRKDCDVTELFVLRTQSLIMLSLSNWRENKFFENMKDYCGRWMKILSNNAYNYDVEEVFYYFAELLEFVLQIVDGRSEKCEKELFEITKNILSLVSKITCFRVENYGAFQMYIEPFFCQLKSEYSEQVSPDQELPLLLCSINHKLTSDINEKNCFCGSDGDANLLEDFVIEYLKKKHCVSNLLATLSWLKRLYQSLKTASCVSPTAILISVISQLLASSYVQKEFSKLSQTARKNDIQIVYFQCFCILQSIEATLSNDDSPQMNCKDTIKENLLSKFYGFQGRLHNFIAMFPPDLQECKCLYATSYKISVKLYQQKKYHETMSSLQLAISLNKLLCKQDESTDVMKHLKEICVICSTFYGCYSQSKLYQECVDVLLENMVYLSTLKVPHNLMRTPEPTKLLQTLIDYYWKVNIRVMELNDNKRKANKCIFEEIHDVCTDQPYFVYLMGLECESIKKQSEKHDLSTQYRKLIEAQKNIHEENGDMVDYAVTMVRLSSLPNTTRKERFHWCEESAGILEEMMNEMAGDEEEWKIRDVLATVYFQQAIILFEDRTEASIDNVDDSLPNIVEDCTEIESNASNELMEQYKIQDFLESDFASMLNSALEMWISVVENFKENDMQESQLYFYDVSNSAHCLYQAAVLFSLIYQNFQAIQASYLSSQLYQILENVESPSESKENLEKKNMCLMFMAMQLLQLDCVQLGEYILNGITCEGENEKVDLVKAAYLIKNGKVADSLEILRSILMKKNMDKNTKSVLLMKSDVYYLMSSLKLLPSTNEDVSIETEEQHYPPSSPFPPVLDCVKYLRSLYENCLANGQVDMLTNWLILDKLLSSLTHHAELLKQQGSVMEAKAYLKEALLLSKKYNLPLRILDILVRITATDIILENSSSFDHNFNTIVAIMNASVGQCFDGRQIYLPEFLTHVAECSCSYCVNPKLQDFHIQLYLQYINGRKIFSVVKSPDFAIYKEAIDSLTSNASSRFQANITSVKQLIGYENKKEGLKNNNNKNKKKQNTDDGKECSQFSKYIAEAKILGENNMLKATAMISNVEQLIAKLESANLSIGKSSHDFQRLIAQLYYLRSVLYIGSKVNNVNSTKQSEAEEPKTETKPASRKTRGRAGVVSKTTRKTAGRRKKKTEDIEDLDSTESVLCQQLDSISIAENTGNLVHPASLGLNDVFLEDLKKVLSTLNPFTDTMIIKSIYELVSFVTASKNPELAICTHFLSSSRTLHQQVLNSIGKKLRKRSDSSTFIPLTVEQNLISTSKLIETYSKPDFVFGNDGLEKLVNENIPEGFTICCISLKEVNEKQYIMMSRTQPNKSPSFIQIHINDDSMSDKQRDVVCDLASAFDESILDKFHKILDENRSSMSIKNKKSWWSERQRLDLQMKSLIQRIEDDWLRGWKGFLLGENIDESAEKQLDELSSRIQHEILKKTKVTIDQSLIKALINGFDHCTEAQILVSIKELCGVKGTEAFQIFLNVLKDSRDRHAKKKCQKMMRKPVVLVLDKILQSLPWESIPTLRNEPVVRMPSILLTSTHCATYKNMLTNGFTPTKTFYILNPKNDLKRTEQMFSEWFQSEKWEGIVGRPPSTNEFAKALTDYDLFVYCGHGSGQEYLGWDAMRRLHCKSVALLMGCSSGKLVAKGTLEAQGMVQYYLLSGSPAVVANLWDVTDKDIDLFLEDLLKIWVTETNGRNLADCVAEARQTCKLEYLIGGAPVVYGLPLVVNPKK